MTTHLPPKIEAQVVTALYEAAERLDWLHISPRDRTNLYSRWLDDPAVGKALLQFMDREQARVWVKDGPMKEYARALSGIGKWAKYAPRQRMTPDRIVQLALGLDWSFVPNSTRIKPLSCTAAKDETERRVIWGPDKDIKHLIWAALIAADQSGSDPLVVVVDSFEKQTPSDVKLLHSRIATRCGVSVKYVSV